MLQKVAEFADELLDKTIVGSFTSFGYALRKPFWDKNDVDMNDKICIVTGANAGLGKVVALELAKRNAHVYMVCRNEQRGKAAQDEIQNLSGNKNVFLEIVDMSIQQSIRGFAERFSKKHQKLDVLINNAGVLLNERQLSKTGVEMTFATNVIGYYLMTAQMLPFLRKQPNSRVINVSSGGMYPAKLNLDDLQFEKRKYDGVQAYAEAKRAEVIMIEKWAKDAKNTSVLFHAMHPGWADTPGVQNSLPLFRKIMKYSLRTPEQGADTIIWLATVKNLKNYPNGSFWFDRQIRPTHKIFSPKNTSEEIEQFWEILNELTNS